MEKTFKGYKGNWIQKEIKDAGAGYWILYKSKTETYNLIGFLSADQPTPIVIIEKTKCNDLKSWCEEHNKKLNQKIQEEMKKLFD